ncbi:MAG: hypothetical protein ACYCWE_03465 [Eubacteriales bacterium]
MRKTFVRFVHSIPFSVPCVLRDKVPRLVKTHSAQIGDAVVLFGIIQPPDDAQSVYL